MSNGDGLTIKQRQTGDIGMVEAKGSLDLRTMAALREALGELLARGVRHVVLDLREVTYVDSAGITVILSAKRGAVRNGGEVYVVTRPGEVHLALHIIQLDRVVHIVDTPEAALAALLPPADEPPV
jgi:stage II sporulation protein AA (anti-sigma F factor antagonist)